MKTPLFPLAVIAALLLSLPARADGKAGEAAASSVQKNKESIEQPATANPNKLPFPISINAPADLAALLREHLSIINRQTEPDADIDQEQMQFLAEEAPDEIKQIVRSQGYFRADIQVAPHGRGWRITAKPGPRTQEGAGWGW